MERFTELLGILAERTLKDVANAVKAAVVYIRKCYRSRDPNFNLETI